MGPCLHLGQIWPVWFCRRVAKKKFKDDQKAGEVFTASAMANLTFATRYILGNCKKLMKIRLMKSPKNSPDNALASADLIVEAITENLPLKQKLFAEWDKVTERKYGSHFLGNVTMLRMWCRLVQRQLYLPPTPPSCASPIA